MQARDRIQDDIMEDACWCVYCIYAGFGCMSPTTKGCCLSIGELCCCAGTCKSATCCDGDGCCATTIKCCCNLFHCEVPPSNTPGCGFSPMLCGGNIADRSEEDINALGPREREEFELLKSTCWCFFFYCFGFGCNSPGGSDACCKLEGKLCCLWANIETDTCCDDGWIELTCKSCCCVVDASYPAGRTPGCVICNAKLCCENLPNKDEPPPE
jgi:hypothetical protein